MQFMWPQLNPACHIAISLKAVSDFADSDKGDEFRAYAAYTSAAVLDLFVTSCILPSGATF